MSGVGITGKLSTLGVGGYPLVDQADVEGGFRSVPDLTTRDGIPALLRVAGMEVYSVADDITYRLGPGLTNSDWVVTGGAGAGYPSLATGSNRDILRMEKRFGNYLNPTGMVSDGTDFWSIKQNIGQAVNPGVVGNATGPGVVRINPTTGVILESVDTGNPSTAVATTLVWTGSRLLLFGYDSGDLTSAWVQEVLPGAPTTFGAQTPLYTATGQEGIITSAIATASNVWLGTMDGSVNRMDSTTLTINLAVIAPSAGNPITAMVYDSIGAHYGDSQPRVFVFDTVNPQITKYKTPDAVPTADGTLALGGGSDRGAIVAGGFLWYAETPNIFGPATIFKVNLVTLVVADSTTSALFNGLVYDLAFDSTNSKLWGIAADGFICGSPGFHIEKFSISPLASDAVYDVPHQELDQAITWPWIRPLGITSTHLFIADPQTLVYNEGTFFKVLLTTGVFTSIDTVDLTVEALKGRVQIIAPTASTWNGVSDILLVFGATFVDLTSSNPDDVGKTVTVIDAGGTATPLTAIGINGQPVNLASITDAGGSKVLQLAQSGTWQVIGGTAGVAIALGNSTHTIQLTSPPRNGQALVSFSGNWYSSDANVAGHIVVDTPGVDQNDYNAGDPDWDIARMAFLTPSAGINITGFLWFSWNGDILAGGSPTKILVNKSSTNSITLKHNNGGSSASNKLFLPGGVDYVIPPFGSVTLIEDPAAGWYIG